MLEKITGQISGILWSTPLVVFILAVGLIYSLRMKFPQLRLVKDQVKVLSSGKSSDAGISSFQGFAMVLGGRVGVGAIAGVATAIYYGGPGSIFWMWVAAILGASVTFGESTLGQLYKEKVGGEYSGGPAFYIKKGIKNKSFGKVLSMVYAFLTLMAVMMTGPSVQAFNIADSMNAAFGLRPILVGAVIALLFVLVTMGGAKRIGSVASVLEHQSDSRDVWPDFLLRIREKRRIRRLDWQRDDVGHQARAVCQRCRNRPGLTRIFCSGGVAPD